MATKLARLKTKAVKIATAKKLAQHPHCTFCGEMANTCHHFIRQSRSNYLRCDERNLIPICMSCHMRLHNGYEAIMAIELEKIHGDEWMAGLIADSEKKIKDGIKYWTELIKEIDV